MKFSENHYLLINNFFLIYSLTKEEIKQKYLRKHVCKLCVDNNLGK